MENLNNIQPMGMGEILDKTLDIYKKNFKKLYLSTLIFNMIIFVVVFVPTFIFSVSAGVVDEIKLLIFIPFLLLIFIVAIIGSVVLQLGMIKAASDSIFEKPLNMLDSFKFGLAKTFPFCVAALVAGLGILFASIFLIIPGIALSIYFTLIAQVTVLEDSGYITALKRSIDLVRGYFWRTFGFTTVMVLLYIVLFSLIPNVLSLIPIPVLPQILGLFVSAAGVPFQMIALTLYYYNQKARIEGYDLQIKAEELLNI